MYNGKTLFSQAMDFLPWKTFHRIVDRYHGNPRVQTLTSVEQFRSMAFAQFNYRENLRDIEACLSARQSKLYHMGFRQPVSRTTLGDTNQKRDWPIYADFAQQLITQARKFYVADPLGRRSNCIPCSICVVQSQALSTGYYASKRYPQHLRRIRFKDPETEKTLVFPTNHFEIPALTVCSLYKSRWQVEFFFKWIKQHLRIKRFYGTSENAAKIQTWIAVSVYVLIAIIKKKLQLDVTLNTLLQIFSVTKFEKIELTQAVTSTPPDQNQPMCYKQLN